MARCCSSSSPDLDLGSNLLTGPLKDSELAEVFDRVRTLLQIEVSDYQMYPGRSEPAAFIASPIFNTAGASHRVRGSGAGQRAGLPRLQRLQRAGRDGRDDGGDAHRSSSSHSLLRHVTSRTRSSSTRCGSATTRRPPCRRPCRASAATARRSTIAASRSSPPGRISLRTAGGWWSSRTSMRRSR